jgi:Bifunctional DNA primase/polymerase, N-terminal
MKPVGSADIKAAIVLAQRLRLIDNGYRPLPIRTWGPQRGLGKAPYLPGWHRLFATPEDAATWKSLSTGIICGTQADGSHLVAVDIDIIDAPLALELEAEVRKVLGTSDLLRIGNAPKRLLLYRCDFPATKLHFVEGGVELLSEGNQFVAFGMHPDTGRPYEWPTGFSPENVALSDVPQATHEQVRALIAWLNVRLTQKNITMPVDGQHDDQPPVSGDDGLIRDGESA